MTTLDEVTQERLGATRAVHTWLRIARVCAKIDRASVAQLRPYGLSVAQFDILAHVGADEGISQKALADHLLVTKGNVTQLLDRMEKRGWIRRQPSGRTNSLFLTESGRRLYDVVVPAHEEYIARLLDALSADELADVQRLLRKLDRSLKLTPETRPAEPSGAKRPHARRSLPRRAPRQRPER